MDTAEIGRRLRAMRTASGRTVASVATDAGLSVPYLANLENGRGNPTVAALGQAAAALGCRLAISFAQDGAAAETGEIIADTPPSLVRLGRTPRFRRVTALIADELGIDRRDAGQHLVTVLARVAAVMRRDLSEADWWRLLDALTLVATSPVPPA